MNRMVAALGVAMTMIAAPAAAQNLVTNPGFETGDFTAWTKFGNFDPTSYNYVTTAPFRGVSGAEGRYVASVGSNYDYQGIAGISQALTTDAARFYDISLLWADDTANNADNHLFQVLWNDVAVITIGANDGSLAYRTLSATVRGTGSDTIAFQGFSNAGYNQMDAVSVTAGAVVAVPEPATWAMMVGGFGLAGAVMRRRARVRFA